MFQSDEKHFTATTRATERRRRELNVLYFTNKTWAFASMLQSDEKARAAMARIKERWMSDFNR